MDVIYKVNLDLIYVMHIDIDIVRIVIALREPTSKNPKKRERENKKGNKFASPSNSVYPSILSTTDIYRILFQLDAPKEAGVFKSNNFVGGRASSMRSASDII